MSKTNSTKATVQYPFLTKKQIEARLQGEPIFVAECLQILGERTAARQTGDKAMGFMVSHKEAGKKLLSVTEGWNEEQVGAARKICLSYTTQLAKHFREQEIAANPDLAEVAKVFSAA